MFFKALIRQTYHLLKSCRVTKITTTRPQCHCGTLPLSAETFTVDELICFETHSSSVYRLCCATGWTHSYTYLQLCTNIYANDEAYTFTYVPQCVCSHWLYYIRGDTTLRVFNRTVYGHWTLEFLRHWIAELLWACLVNAVNGDFSKDLNWKSEKVEETRNLNKNRV